MDGKMRNLRIYACAIQRESPRIGNRETIGSGFLEASLAAGGRRAIMIALGTRLLLVLHSPGRQGFTNR